MERQALTQPDSDYPDGFRVYSSDQEVPWKAVYLAVGLLVAGVVLLFTGVGLWATDPAAHGKRAVNALGQLSFMNSTKECLY